MDKVYLGKFVNTHGIKGEIRIKSDFEYKDQVFKIGSKIYIANEEFTIISYRKHKDYDMVKLDGINSIEQIETLKNASVYVDRNDYDFDILYSDLIGMDVYQEGIYCGKVVEITKNILYPILKVQNKGMHLIPYTDKFVKSIDKNNNVISINYIKGLCDED